MTLMPLCLNRCKVWAGISVASSSDRLGDWSGHRGVGILEPARSGVQDRAGPGVDDEQSGSEYSPRQAAPRVAGGGIGPGSAAARRVGESVESFVVVLVAFLLWSLEAEGFVIPTGSM